MKNLIKLAFCVCLLFASLGAISAQGNGVSLSNSNYTTLEKLEIKAAKTYQSIQNGDLVANWSVLQSMIVKVAYKLRDGQSISNAISKAYAETLVEYPNRKLALGKLKTELEILLNN